MQVKSFFLFFFSVVSCVSAKERCELRLEEKPIVVIIPSYNNIDIYQQNIDSVLAQDYSNFRVIYIDDCSTDGMSSVVENYIEKHDHAGRIVYIHNSENKGALENIYNAVYSCADHEIIATVDGDDWLIDKDVLSKINEAYQNPNVWLTYGQYIMQPGGGRFYLYDYPNDIIIRNAYREHVWLASHMRTFYAWLFKKINKEDLMHRGSFYQVTWDMAFMFPMLEMAAGRFTCMPDPIYVYNIGNPLNDFRIRSEEQQEIDRFIRSKKRYAPLDSLVFHGDAQ